MISLKFAKNMKDTSDELLNKLKEEVKRFSIIMIINIMKIILIT